MSGRAHAADDLPLYKTDEQIAAALGVGYDRWLANARVLEKDGLPPRDPLFSGKRYWPAVRAFLDRRAGLDARSGVFGLDGKEDFQWLNHRRRAS